MIAGCTFVVGLVLVGTAEWIFTSPKRLDKYIPQSPPLQRIIVTYSSDENCIYFAQVKIYIICDRGFSDILEQLDCLCLSRSNSVSKLASPSGIHIDPGEFVYLVKS